LTKLSISGPETPRILKDVEGSHSIKLVKSFEFDPYLCDQSHIQTLRRICHKIKGTKRLNLVIRRVETSNELDNLCPFIARFTKTESIRIEFPNTQNVTENSFIKLYQAIGNFSFLKSYEWKDINMPERSKKVAQMGLVCFSKLRLLENIQVYGVLKKGAIRDEISQSPKWKDSVKLNRVKYINAASSVSGQWADMGIEKDYNVQMLTHTFKKIPQLEKMKIKSMKALSNYEATLTFFTAISQLKNFHHLEWELLNCRVGDMEVVAYVHGLMKVKQIKYFSLKVIQNPNISEDCLEKVAHAMSRLESLLGFDLYFRKLNLHSQAIKELGKRIETYENIHCLCSKESIHIYKRNPE